MKQLPLDIFNYSFTTSVEPTAQDRARSVNLCRRAAVDIMNAVDYDYMYNPSDDDDCAPALVIK